MSKKIVVGNWKMNLLKEEAAQLTSEIISTSGQLPEDVRLVLVPAFIHLSTVKSIISQTPRVFLAAQNCSDKNLGAYTGEVSAAMLKSYGVDYVIIGHSERRGYFKETNQQLAEKVDRILEQNMQAIFCCGEVMAEREANREKEVVEQQLKKSLFHLSEGQLSKVVIAYEPVWAIGTGRTATAAQAQQMHQTIRQLLRQQYGKSAADEVSILYGGSCKPANAAQLFACPDVDGGLIGGASLKSVDFITIAKSH